MSKAVADICVVGLAVMGQNLILNMYVLLSRILVLEF